MAKADSQIPSTYFSIANSTLNIQGCLSDSQYLLWYCQFYFSIAKADSHILSTYFSIANSTLAWPRLTLRFPVLTLALPILL